MFPYIHFDDPKILYDGMDAVYVTSTPFIDNRTGDPLFMARFYDKKLKRASSRGYFTSEDVFTDRWVKQEDVFEYTPYFFDENDFFKRSSIVIVFAQTGRPPINSSEVARTLLDRLFIRRLLQVDKCDASLGEYQRNSQSKYEHSVRYEPYSISLAKEFCEDVNKALTEYDLNVLPTDIYSRTMHLFFGTNTFLTRPIIEKLSTINARRYINDPKLKSIIDEYIVFICRNGGMPDFEERLARCPFQDLSYDDVKHNIDWSLRQAERYEQIMK